MSRVRRQPVVERIGGLDELGPLAAKLKTQARERAEAERLQRAQASPMAREANLFRDAVADAVALPPAGRADPGRPAPACVPRQRQLDERAVLDASLSDEIGIEQYLETDDALSYRRHGIGPDVVRRLRRGQWSVKGQIDLHGLRTDEARAAPHRRSPGCRAGRRTSAPARRRARTHSIAPAASAGRPHRAAADRRA